MKRVVSFLVFSFLYVQVGLTQNKPALHFITKEINRIAVDSFYTYSFAAFDSSGSEIKYTVHNLPGWLSYNSNTHTISGKNNTPGQCMVHISAATTDTVVHQYFMLTVFNNKTKNILALGNSITNGTDKYNSYRRALWQLLQKQGYNFDMIGSWSSHHMGGPVPDPDFDMDHDGHSGWKASDVIAPPDWDKQRGNIHDWLQQYTPDIVLLELGTNEVFQCVTVKDALHYINAIIDSLRKKNKQVKILLAQIPPLGKKWADKKLCGNTIAYITVLLQFNKQVKIFAAKKNTAVSPVMIVDQFTGIVPATDLYDDIHPNKKGEQKMAVNWYRAISRYLSKK